MKPLPSPSKATPAAVARHERWQAGKALCAATSSPSAARQSVSRFNPMGTAVDAASSFAQTVSNEGKGHQTKIIENTGIPSKPDSSLGGPVLWPRSQPWPHREDAHPATALSPQGEAPYPSRTGPPALRRGRARSQPAMLQALWCPFDHEPCTAPGSEIFWRDKTQGDLEPADPPRPADAPRVLLGEGGLNQ